ncbi:hypothetical protein GCK72_004457 [Caenorhabditis remanei]|uniref:RRM domain-containing protein n=1 Tax=Caenorhabditis remanei TaxID=31234 RepID=A0A6A5HBW6_CAERE|nr:hypothetical protein GCK72_004457 [Caenorhabditis remanei]KAF1764509.1 hypothetical protein GCK72_004457 [Caenorhabditis remanei]
MSSISNNNNNCNYNSMEEELEAEAAVLKEIQNKLSSMGNVAPPTPEEQKLIDSRSIFVGNVDYGTTVEGVHEHFKDCGEITRITIPKDKTTQRQKNYAFVEFASSASLETAIEKSGLLFRARQIVVTSKRTNKPGMGVSSGGGFRGGREFQKTVFVKYIYVNGSSPNRGFRGAVRGGRGRFSPY